MCRTDRRKGRGRSDQHLRADFVWNRVGQRHHRASRNDDFVPPRAWRVEESHPEPWLQSQTRVDPDTNFAYDASAFESGEPATRGDRRRRSRRRRPHDPSQIAWMDRCVGYADSNLIWSVRLGWDVFGPKHLRRLSEFVVGNSSHASLQRPSAERQLNPARIDEARQTFALRRPRQARRPQLSFLRFSNAFHVIFASISAMRPQGGGTVLGMRRSRR